MSDRKPATAADVRAWARRVGLTVGTRGHLPVAVIEKFNKRHRAHHAESHNPFLGRDAYAPQEANHG